MRFQAGAEKIQTTFSMAATVNSDNSGKRNISIVNEDGSVVTQIGSRILRGSLSDSATVTLPDATANKFLIWTIDNDTGSTLSINTVLSQTIGGLSTYDLTNNTALTVYSNGTNWRII